MRVDRPLLLLLAALTAGCADPEPFVDTGAPMSPQVNKPRDPVLESGSVALCFSDKTPWPQVEALAQERCAAHGLQARAGSILRWQCRATSPHRASFLCYDPDMVLPSGQPVNPFNAKAVAEWEKLTGKTAKPHNFMTNPGRTAVAPTATGTTAAPAAAAPAPVTPMDAPPAPAPVVAPAPLPPLTPADIAGRPAMTPLPPSLPAPAAPPPPPAGAYPMDGFTLPQGSWGDHFQD